MTDLHDAGAASDESGIWATDAFLEALASGTPVDEDGATALLSALVADISADPLPALPTVAARRRRRLGPRTGIATAAAFVVVSTGGVAAASVGAGPTSALFPLHRVLTGQPQLDGSQRQALEVKDRLRSAAEALAAGKVARAQKDVAAAAGRLPKVAATDGHRDLAAQWSAIDNAVKARAIAAPDTSATPKPGPAATPTRTSAPAVSTSGKATQPTPTTHQSPTSGRPHPTSSPAGLPVVGGAPTTGLTSPNPGSPTPAPSATPTTTPSPSDSVVASDTPAPSGTTTGKGGGGKGTGGGKGGGKSHRPGKGGGTTVAPGSPPAPSLSPPAASDRPVTVPPVTVPPVTVPPVTVPSVTTVPPATATAAPPPAPVPSGSPPVG